MTKKIDLPKFRGMILVSMIALAIASCGTPDQRSYEDGWRVFRNQCDDISSTVKTKVQYQMSGQRKVTLFDQQNKNIHKFDIAATRSGVTIMSTSFANDLSNSEIETKKISQREINDVLDEAIDTYFDQPGKHTDVRYGCLLKGLASS